MGNLFGDGPGAGRALPRAARHGGGRGLLLRRPLHPALPPGRVPQPRLRRGPAQQRGAGRRHHDAGYPGGRPPGLAVQPLRVPGQAAARGPRARADDPAAVRRRDRFAADPGHLRRAERAAGPGPGGLARARPLLRRGPAAVAGALSDPVPQRLRGAGQHRSGHGRGRGEPGLPRPAQVRAHHAAADHAGLLCGRGHRLHLELHGAGHAADHELHALRARAGLRRAQGDRGQPLPVRARVRDALRERPALRHREARVRAARLRDAEQGDDGRRGAHGGRRAGPPRRPAVRARRGAGPAAAHGRRAHEPRAARQLVPQRAAARPSPRATTSRRSATA